MSGIQVWTHPATDAKVTDAAYSLVETLNSIGLETVPKLQNARNPITDIINLNVGTKQ